MSHVPRILVTLLVSGSLAASLGVVRTGAAGPHALTLDYTTAGTLLVTTEDGTAIRTNAAPGVVISPGAYQVIVNDDLPDSRDTQHAFRLQGPGVNLQTDMASGDNKTELYDVTLAQSATYTFADDRQPTLAHVVFSTAGSASAATGTTGAAGGSSSGTTSNSSVVGSDVKSVKFRGNLGASVASNGKLALTAGGSPILKLLTGRYNIRVVDRSANAGFTMQAAGKRAITLTAGAFVGRRTVAVVLTTGAWVYYSPSGKRRSFTVVG
jgi:hypothetical protein